MTSLSIDDFLRLRQMFLILMIDIETFTQNLGLTILDINQASAQFNALRKRYAECVGKIKVEYAFTGRLQKKVQKRVNQELEMKGWL